MCVRACVRATSGGGPEVISSGWRAVRASGFLALIVRGCKHRHLGTFGKSQRCCLCRMTYFGKSVLGKCAWSGVAEVTLHGILHTFIPQQRQSIPPFHLVKLGRH